MYKLDLELLNKIRSKVVGIFRKERSYHGFELDVLKSAIQKYARRGETDKLAYCMVELDLFAEVLDDRGERVASDKRLHQFFATI